VTIVSEGDAGMDRTLAAVSRRLIPFLFVLYVAAYLDRINVGFAQLQMKDELGFSASVYGLGAGIFFFGYFLFEVPSNLLLARIGARVWIARIMITWGLISAAMAFIETPGQFYVLRFLLGAAEAGFFPGVIYYLSQWFPAAQRATAIARFMTATAIAGVIGGPLSGVLLGLDGVAGLAGWQLIFVAEGLPSVALGVVVLFYLTDSPREAEWLSVEERTRLTARLSAEADEIAARGTTSVRAALLHPLVWRLAALYFSLIVGFYSVSFWLPQIVQSLSTLGIVEVATVSAIPYVAAAIAMTIVGRRSDRVGERCRHIAVAALVGAVALAGAGAIESPVAAIVVLSVAAMGIWSAVPVFWMLPTTLLSGTAAAAAIALVNSFGNLGGFVGPYVTGVLRDATGDFATGLVAIAALLLVGVLLALSFRNTAADPAGFGSNERSAGSGADR
jgi:D-galactonate transporter